ncbi:hypothetical protein [Leeuwenhoekiella sp. UBA6783]|uniref:hypothetical protein n=1 Tax=Leeuwenhoekiella sp. UBA6783 TaxID=1946747 RepID=UPI0025BD9239|nr:hypothetical protein [Leeuwenhoekiella sp. UBA6783]|tara:strand:+ start:129 stop:509 length:381 start_codon:yes stop_codon:yes gene_type:complete
MKPLFFVLLFLVFAGCEISNERKRVSKETAIISEIKNEESFNRGFINVDKQYYISQNTKSISNNRLIQLGDIEPPYLLIKNRGSDTLIVIKKSDTLFFKLIDYSKDSKYDPTFKDLIRSLFGDSIQ